MTADRIAWLEQQIEHADDLYRQSGHQALFKDRADNLRAELSRLRNEQPLCEDCPPDGYPTDKTRCAPCPRRNEHPELNSRGEPMDGATIARGRKPTDAENAPLRNEQPKGGERPPTEHEMALVRMYETDIPFDPLGEAAPSPATSPGPQDVRGLIADLRNWPATGGRGDGLSATVVGDLMNRAADALAALAQSDAQPVGDSKCPTCGASVDVSEITSELLSHEAQDRGRPTIEPLWQDVVKNAINSLRDVLENPIGNTEVRTNLAKITVNLSSLLTTPPSLPEGAREALEFTDHLFSLAFDRCEIESCEIMELGEKLGLLEQVAYDPKIHEGDIDADEGDMIFVRSAKGKAIRALASAKQEPAPSADAEEVAKEAEEQLQYNDYNNQSYVAMRKHNREIILAALRRYAGDGGVTWQPIETAPRTPWVRIIGWCVFPAGAEWREVQCSPSGEWRAYGLTQNVTHWLPRPEYPPPAARAKPGEKAGGAQQ